MIRYFIAIAILFFCLSVWGQSPPSQSFDLGDVTGTSNPPATEATQQQILTALGGSSGGVIAVSQSGTWTTGRTWSLLNSTDSVDAVQSGVWTVGRSWSLSSGSDSVSASISNFPVLQDVNLTQLAGASFSALNFLPVRISNGATYVDPTQIRLLTSADVVTANQGGSWTVTANAGTGTFQTNVTNSSLAVTGTFWQATQPVSIASMPSTPVTGTFWQATQPVSIATMPSTPVTGTFWQATQPISAATLPLPTGAATESTLGSIDFDVASIDTNVIHLTATTATTAQNFGINAYGIAAASAPTLVAGNGYALSLDLSGGLRVNGSGYTQPVSIATAPALVAGTAIIGKVGIDQTTPGTTNGVQVNAALPAGSNVIGHVIADSGSTTAVTGNVASTVADGANVTLGAKADAKSTATDTTAITIMSVLKEISAMEQAPASRAVTNAGTFAVQSTPVTPTATTLTSAAVTVGTAATRLVTSGTTPPTTRVLLVAQYLTGGTASCFLGGSGVTSSGAGRGAQMFAGQTWSFSNDAGDYYAICDASSQTFLVTEQK